MAIKDADTSKRATPEIRAYLKRNPDCSYEQLIKDLSIKSLSRPWFYTLRTQARSTGVGKHNSQSYPKNGQLDFPGAKAIMKVEILETIDASGFSEELKGYYKSHFFPTIQKVVPDGSSLQMVILADPSRIEIRRIVL